MRNSRLFIASVGIVVAIATTGLLVRSLKKSDSRSTSEPITPSPTPVDKKEAIKITPDVSPISSAPITSSSLRLNGVVQSDSHATITVRMPAKIVSVRVEEGQKVMVGQVLIVLDDADFVSQEKTAAAGVLAAKAQLTKAIVGMDAQRLKADTDIETAKAGLKTAKVKLAQAILGRDALKSDATVEHKLAEEGVRKAQLGLESARKTQASLEALDKVGGVSRNDLEGARTGVKIAQSDLDTAKTQLTRLEASPKGEKSVTYRFALAQKDVEAAQEGVTQAQSGVKNAIVARVQLLRIAEGDIVAARASVSQAEAGKSGASSARNASTLTSPFAGTVSGITARTGETAQPGVPLLTLRSLNGMRVEALVTSRQLTRLKVGQSATLTSDSLPGKSFSAILSELAPTAEPDGRTYRVRFSIRSASSAPSSLSQGSSVFIQTGTQ